MNFLYQFIFNQILQQKFHTGLNKNPACRNNGALVIVLNLQNFQIFLYNKLPIARMKQCVELTKITVDSIDEKKNSGNEVTKTIFFHNCSKGNELWKI